MACCKNQLIMRIVAKCNDSCYIEFPDGTDYEGYVPESFNIGDGDYIRICLCMNCGKIDGKFPIEIPKEDEDDY